jgi:hypothetical protein
VFIYCFGPVYSPVSYNTAVLKGVEADIVEIAMANMLRLARYNLDLFCISKLMVGSRARLPLVVAYSYVRPRGNNGYDSFTDLANLSLTAIDLEQATAIVDEHYLCCESSNISPGQFCWPRLQQCETTLLTHLRTGTEVYNARPPRQQDHV